MNGRESSGDGSGWWPRGLWWAWPTALALLGASIVSLVLVPGSAEHTSVPRQVVVTRAQQAPSTTPDGHHGSSDRPHPRGSATATPTATVSPSDDHTEEPTIVVTPSRHIESEAPDDDGREDLGDDHGGDRR